jgi:hypothetical protein
LDQLILCQTNTTQSQHKVLNLRLLASLTDEQLYQEGGAENSESFEHMPKSGKHVVFGDQKYPVFSLKPIKIQAS